MKDATQTIVKQGLFFTVATLTGNVINLIFNFYLGRTLSTADFALIALFIGFIYAINVFFSALSLTVSHSVGMCSISNRKKAISQIVHQWRKYALTFGVFITIFWIAATPFLAQLWKTSIINLILFVPVFIFGSVSCLNRGILQGKLRFSASGSTFIVEAVIKLSAAFVFVLSGLAGLAFVSIPISVFSGYLVSIFFLRKVPKDKSIMSMNKIPSLRLFSRRFFFFSLLLGFSTLTFLSIDVILAKIYFSADDAGAYALITLGGKILFLFSSLLGAMIVPVVSNAIGKKKNTKNIFRVFFGVSLAIIAVGTMLFILFGKAFFLFFFGQKVLAVIPIFPLYITAIAAFSLVNAIVLYHHARRKFVFPIVSSVSAIFFILGTILFHATLGQFIAVLFAVAVTNLICVGILHLFSGHIAPQKIEYEDENAVLEEALVSKNIPTIVIGIPAYNEQYNIGNILEQILQQNQEGFVIEKIIIVSDGSTDNTVGVASEYEKFGVSIIARNKNCGLNFTQNEIIQNTSSDILVLLNADILLGDNNVITKLVTPIINGADLSASWTLPLAPRTFVEHILCAGFELKYWVYKHYKNGDNIYTCIGANRALSRRFYNNVTFPLVSDGEDQYLYLTCISGGYIYKYAGSTNTFFKLPDTFSDYKKYAKRIFQTQKKYGETFGELAIEERKIPMQIMFRGCIYGILKHPFFSSLYVVMHIIMQQWALRQSVCSSHTFEVSQSTKKLQYEIE